MKQLLILIIFGIIIFSQSCEIEKTTKKVNKTQKVLGNLYIRYIKPDQHIKATADFYTLDTDNKKTPIEIEGGVSFRGGGTGRRNIAGKMIRYNYENDEPFLGNYSFGFLIPDDEKKHVIDISISPIDSFYFPDNIIKTKETTFIFIGEDLKENESLVFLFTNNSNSSSSFVIKGPSKDKRINITDKQLSSLPSGKGEIYVVRKKQEHFNGKNYLLNSTIEYYSNIIDVEIMP